MPARVFLRVWVHIRGVYVISEVILVGRDAP
jgi:hypothetical protein